MMSTTTVAADANQIRAIPNDYSHYIPINSSQREIRILILHPANNPNDLLICSLIKTSLNHDSPIFSALSYCWGDLSKTKAIFIRHFEDQVSLCGERLQKAGQDSSFQDLGNATICEEYQITETLHSGLCEFRSRTEPRFLWADALCINQGDIAERSQQVQFMRAVYERAEEVLVWLTGPVGADFDGMDFLQDVLEFTRSLARRYGMSWEDLVTAGPDELEIRKFWNKILVRRGEVSEHDDEGDEADDEADSDEELDDRSSQVIEWILGPSKGNGTRDSSMSPGARPIFLSFIHLMLKVRSRQTEAQRRVQEIFKHFEQFLLRLEWFSRAWVLQEVGSNPNVIIHYGDQSVPWESLSASDIIRTSLNYVAGMYLDLGIPSAWWLVTKGKQRYRLPLLELMVQTMHFRATDVRDSIYAKLGLMSELIDPVLAPPSPDYTKTIREIFTKFTQWIILHHKKLDVLSFACRSHRLDETRLPFPSWVPDYSEWLPLVCLTFGIFSPYDASAGTQVAISTQDWKDELCLEGYHIRTARSVHEVEIQQGDEGSIICKDDTGTIISVVVYFWRLLLEKMRPHLGIDQDGAPATTYAERFDHLISRLPVGKQRSQFRTEQDDTRLTENVRGIDDLLRRYVRCLRSTSSENPITDTTAGRLRGFGSYETAMGGFAAYFLKKDPELRGFSKEQEITIRRLALNVPQGQINWFRDHYRQSLPGRGFFITDDYDFALCPKGTEAGDIVVILDGGSVPYILRRRASNAGENLQEESYEFIGECYLERFMDGSALSSGHCGDGETETEYQKRAFTIC
jgi:hypothetical protein